MKRKHLFFIVLILSVFACKKKDPDLIAPTLALKTGDGYVYISADVEGDTTLKFGISGDVGDAESFSNIKVLRSYDGSEWEVELDSNISSATIDFDYSFVPRNFLGAERWSILVTDDLDLQSSATIDITTREIELSGLRIYDICGGTQNAYNLLDDQSYDIPVMDSAASVPDSLVLDMINDFTCDTSMNYYWKTTSNSQTTFIVLDSTYDYNSIVREDMVALFDSETGYGYSSRLSSGKISNSFYIAKLREGESYAAIKVTNIVVGDSTNYGYFEFSYKK